MEGAGSLTLFSSSWRDRLRSDVVPGTRVVDQRVPGKVLNFAWHRLGRPPVERLAGGPYDDVQAFHPLLIPTRGAAQVVTIHDLDFLDHPDRTRAEIRRDYPALAGVHARRAHRVIVNSETTRREVEARLGVPGTRMTVCYPGAPRWAQRLQEPPDGCILFLGSLEPRKNLGVLLDAYERLLSRRPHVPRLVLAGRPGPDMTLLTSRLADRPLKGAVDLPGYVEPGGREALFRQALLFVMPSHTEGFGMPVVEAMTIGVPVVASNRGALPEVGGDAAVSFEPDDADGLSLALERLLVDAAERQRLRALGWRQARQFDWAASAGRLREAWMLACEERRSRD
jgi:glycosyltransferase involved in cell wall biosynthesis